MDEEKYKAMIFKFNVLLSKKRSKLKFLREHKFEIEAQFVKAKIDLFSEIIQELEWVQKGFHEIDSIKLDCL